MVIRNRVSLALATLLFAIRAAGQPSAKLVYPAEGQAIGVEEGRAGVGFRFELNETGCGRGTIRATELFVDGMQTGVRSSDRALTGSSSGVHFLAPGEHTWTVNIVCDRVDAPRGEPNIWDIRMPPVHFRVVPCSAKVAAVNGDVYVNGRPAWDTIVIDGLPTRAYKEAFEGDVVSTGPKSRVMIVFSDGTSIRLSHDTKFQVPPCPSEARPVTSIVIAGTIMAHIAHWVGGDAKDVRFKTPISIGGPRDTTIEVSYDSSQRLAVQRTVEGTSWVANTNGKVKKKIELPPGHCGSVKSGSVPSAPYPCPPLFLWDEGGGAPLPAVVSSPR